VSERKPAADLVISDEGIKVLADREALKTVAYLDERGILTIGVGHTSAAGPPVVTQGMTITKAEALAIFRRDGQRFRKECIKLVTAPLHQHEFDALASFVFNLGSTQFASSTALKRLNARDYKGCAAAMLWWNKPRSIISRRKGEVDQFLNGNYVARVTR